jgi:hypothetical protein
LELQGLNDIFLRADMHDTGLKSLCFFGDWCGGGAENDDGLYESCFLRLILG